MSDVDKLLAVCRAATPGPWLNGERIEECASVVCDHADIYVMVDGEARNVMCATCSPEDARYITTFSPDRVAKMLELLAEANHPRRTWTHWQDEYLELLAEMAKGVSDE